MVKEIVLVVLGPDYMRSVRNLIGTTQTGAIKFT